MKATDYAEALYRASLGKGDEDTTAITERLVAMLREHGHLALLPAITRELEKLIRRRQTDTEAIVRVAHAADVERYRERIAADLRTLDAVSLPLHTVVSPQVIGGYELRANGKRIDRTYKRSLLALYTTLVRQS